MIHGEAEPGRLTCKGRNQPAPSRIPGAVEGGGGASLAGGPDAAGAGAQQSACEGERDTETKRRRATR